MAYRRGVTTILVFAYFVFANCCDSNDVAVYKVKLKMLWSEETFPKDYPNNRPKAQWSPVFGQSHNSSYGLYRVGELAKPTVLNFAQYGKIDELVKEGEDDPKVYDQFSAPAVGMGIGETENVVVVDGGHSLVSFICHMIPSPDWFVGVDSVDLCVDFSWIDQMTLDLEPLDAGAAQGLTFTAPRWASNPPEPVTKHKPRKPNDPAAGFYYPDLRELPTIAKVEFNKIKGYTSKNLNELIRKEAIADFKQKNDRKQLLQHITKENEDVDVVDVDTEIKTKSKVDRLKELEEEPFGTPAPNQPDNNVIVVTESPVTSVSEEFGEGLHNMDDVVLAVAKGRKLGLGRHLPRHFRSRLHHAVNRIKPDDCLVSKWGEWTPCSKTCGFGEKYRSRTVIREKTGKGRDCPSLIERDHCGNDSSCPHMEYFEW